MEGRQSRITIGVILPVGHCFVGACAKLNKPNDTWALTDDINYDIFMPKMGGHEMVITGYNDTATVTDNDGKTHQGVFTLRNSWGTDVGDEGNFYMTYDFFKKFVFEVQQVVMVEKDEKQDNNQR
jgi:C1A family cysteine protease